MSWDTLVLAELLAAVCDSEHPMQVGEWGIKEQRVPMPQEGGAHVPPAPAVTCQALLAES